MASSRSFVAWSRDGRKSPISEISTAVSPRFAVAHAPCVFSTRRFRGFAVAKFPKSVISCHFGRLQSAACDPGARVDAISGGFLRKSAVGERAWPPFFPKPPMCNRLTCGNRNPLAHGGSNSRTQRRISVKTCHETRIDARSKRWTTCPVRLRAASLAQPSRLRSLAGGSPASDSVIGSDRGIRSRPKPRPRVCASYALAHCVCPTPAFGCDRSSRARHRPPASALPGPPSLRTPPSNDPLSDNACENAASPNGRPC